MGANCSSLEDILEEDMHHWYTKFMRESPSGLITLFELKTMLEMNGMTEEASSYVDQVFYTFDMDGVKSSSGLLRSLLMLYNISNGTQFSDDSRWCGGREGNVLACSGTTMVGDFKIRFLPVFRRMAT